MQRTSARLGRWRPARSSQARSNPEPWSACFSRSRRSPGQSGACRYYTKRCGVHGDRCGALHRQFNDFLAGAAAYPLHAAARGSGRVNMIRPDLRFRDRTGSWPGSWEVSVGPRPTTAASVEVFSQGPPPRPAANNAVPTAAEVVQNSERLPPVALP